MRALVITAGVLALAGCPANAPEAPLAPPSKPSPPPGPASQPASQPVAPPVVPAIRATDGSTNTSGMTQEACPSAEPCPCRGALQFGLTALAKIGIGEEHLAGGTPCLIADLDKNGFSDLVFVDASYGRVEGNVRQVASVTVLFFDGVGLRMIEELPKKVGVLSVDRGPEGSRLIAGTAPNRLVFELVNGHLQGKKL